jgi:non-homologous end joining protein Ku
MRGDNHVLAVTTTKDEVTGNTIPLFAFPVQVCKATQDTHPKFEVVAPSGQKRVQQYVDPATGEVLANGDELRGVFVGDVFKPIAQEAIDAIDAEEKITTMVVEGTKPLNGLREKYGDRISDRYFLQSPAKGGSAPAYRLVYEGLLPAVKGKKVEREAMALVLRRTKRTKQALNFIYADAEEGCLVMCEVKYAEQMREPDDQVKAPMLAQVTDAQVAKVRAVIDGLPDATDVLDNAVDSAAVAKAKLIEEAIAGATEFTIPTPVSTTVAQDDLEALLNKSLAAVG